MPECSDFQFEHKWNSSFPLGGRVVFVIPRRFWRGIQNLLIFRYLPGFRVSPSIFGLARNDSSVELRHSLWREGEGEEVFFKVNYRSCVFGKEGLFFESDFDR